jgi:NADPH-dependent glutamate synthase beta subunit-like oxidoreductase
LIVGRNFRETLNEQLKDPEFQAEWESLEPERQIVKAMSEGREEQDLAQKELSQRAQKKGRHPFSEKRPLS